MAFHVPCTTGSSKSVTSSKPCVTVIRPFFTWTIIFASPLSCCISSPFQAQPPTPLVGRFVGGQDSNLPVCQSPDLALIVLVRVQTLVTNVLALTVRPPVGFRCLSCETSRPVWVVVVITALVARQVYHLVCSHFVPFYPSHHWQVSSSSVQVQPHSPHVCHLAVRLSSAEFICRSVGCLLPPPSTSLRMVNCGFMLSLSCSPLTT